MPLRCPARFRRGRAENQANVQPCALPVEIEQETADDAFLSAGDEENAVSPVRPLDAIRHTIERGVCQFETARPSLNQSDCRPNSKEPAPQNEHIAEQQQNNGKHSAAEPATASGIRC